MRENQAQKTTIRQLETELVLLREKIERAPKDRSAELAEMRELVRNEERRIGELEEEIRDLRERRNTMEQAFRDYQREYPIP